MLPKFKLLYFKNLLDIVFNKFFDLYGNDFTKVENKYVLSKNFSKQKLNRIFKALIVEVLKEHIVKFDILNPQYFIIIGACMPKNNILLKFNDCNSFPKKLNKLLNSEYLIKYFLKEDDIVIDNIKFNEVCIDIFNSFFTKNSVKHFFGTEFSKNVIFIQHNRLDCYSMFKIIKTILGKANCINMYLDSFSNIHSPIIAINDIIDKYTVKNVANKDQEFKNIINEIRIYIKELTNYGN